MYYLCNNRSLFALSLKNLVVILCLLLGLNATSQRIINFNLYPTSTLVGIKFTLTKGSDCGGYKILHSTDSLNFTVIEDYAGICGNTSADDTKNFTHTSPVLNQKNYYKVVLATSEASVIRGVYIASSNSDAVKAYPNPMDANNGILNCRVNGSGTSKLKAIIYGQNGKVFRELEVYSKSDVVTIEVGNLRNGMYLLEITNGDKPYTTKFLINR